jgi:hypothetical protein
MIIAALWLLYQETPLQAIVKKSGGCRSFGICVK